MRRKKITACILVAVLLIGALYIVQRLLVPKYQTGIVEGSMVEEYYKDRSDHEVLFVGDCEVYENFSTIELWRKYGITSYIRGSAQQLTWQSYYLLEDALKYETPKVVVFNVLALKYNEPQSEAYNRMSIDGMKWSMSKVNDIKASMTDEENFVDYIFPLLRYHSRWSELTKDDVKHIFAKDKVTHNGYYMRVDTKPQQEFPDPTPLTDYKLGDKAMGYLQKMTDLCKEKGVKLVLIKAPTEYPYWYEQWDEQVQQFADENDVDYINFIPLQNDIGLDMSQDTYDAGLHLNTTGAEKMADYFGKYLVENYNLTDYRNDSEYASIWDKKEAAYEDVFTYDLKGVTVAMNENMEPLVKKLGDADNYFESDSCAFQGKDKVYTYGSVKITTYPKDNKDYVYTIELLDDTVSTPEGISIGSDKKAVEEKYGDASDSTETSYIYKKGDSQLSFIFDGDNVSSIVYNAITE